MALMLPEPVTDVGALLGEGPAWDAGRGCLWFVDIKQRHLYRFEPLGGALQRWVAPEQIGWALPARDGTLVCGLRGGLYRFSPDSGHFEPWLAVETHLPGNRLNDATVDADGALWFGSMDDEECNDSGFIYRCAQGQMTQCALPPVCITNGPALSPDGATLYHSDTLGRRIFASRLDEARLPRDTRVFVTIEDGAGYPDGPVVDSEGCLWTGLFGGWSARRYSPQGKLLDTVRFPVANVTKLAFGGKDLRTVYATTARKGLSAAELAGQPRAGDLFAFRVAVAGLPLPLAH
jgi:sugar lactone lactonase YvrE